MSSTRITQIVSSTSFLPTLIYNFKYRRVHRRLPQVVVNLIEGVEVLVLLLEVEILELGEEIQIWALSIQRP
jgi:hypothetical protein